MKGRPEQSFLDTFSERFMNHVRQVRAGPESESIFIISYPFRSAHLQNQFLDSNVFIMMIKLAY